MTVSECACESAGDTSRDRMSSSTDVVPEPPVTNNHVQEEGQFADDGDGDFIPVVKEKRKNKAAEKQPGEKQASGGPAKSGGKSGQGSSRRRGRRSAASAAAVPTSSGSGGEAGPPETAGGSDNGTADEHSADDTPKKFVEAPIPAVNVWKVSVGTRGISGSSRKRRKKGKSKIA